MTPSIDAPLKVAVVGCGISVTLDGNGVCTAARVALGAVAPTVILVQAAADALIGHTLDADTLAKLDAAELMLRKATSIGGETSNATRCAGTAWRETSADPEAAGVHSNHGRPR